MTKKFLPKVGEKFTAKRPELFEVIKVSKQSVTIETEDGIIAEIPLRIFWELYQLNNN